MPRQCLVEQVGGVARVRPSREGTVEVIAQLIPERRVRAALNDPWRPVPGSQPAQVGEALLGHNDVYVVFGVVDVADHRDDRRDGATLGRRGRQEETADALRAKSPLPPMPFMIALPMTWVEFTLP